MGILSSFWSEWFWFGNTGVKWTDFDNSGDVYHPQLYDMCIPLITAALIIVIRKNLERYVFTPFGIICGIPNEHRRSPPLNPILEKSYKQKKFPSDDTIKTGDVHEESFHGLQPDDVLHGELQIQVMDYVSQILKIQFNCRHGMLAPSYLHALEMAKEPRPGLAVDKDINVVQIHFVTNHFLVSAQINRHLHVYDSLYNVHHLQSVQFQMNLIYNEVNINRIHYTVPQSQGVTNLCGFFAISNAHTLLQNMLPGSQHLDSLKMRNHLYHCLQTGCIEKFPESLLRIPKTLQEGSSADNTQHSNLMSGMAFSASHSQSRNIVERKCKSRQNSDVRELEKQTDRLYKQNIRKDQKKRIDERVKQKEYKKKIRTDQQKRSDERVKEKEYKQKIRTDQQKRSDERLKQKEYKQKVRKDQGKRSSEQVKQKAYKQKVRKDQGKRSSEQVKQKEYKQKVRKDQGKRSSEQVKQKEYKQKVRKDQGKRSSEQVKQKEYKQKVRKDQGKRSSEQVKQKAYKQKIRKDQQRRCSEQVKEREYKEKVRKDHEKRNKEKQRDRELKQKHKVCFQKKLDPEVVINMFHEECKQIPSFVCGVCYRLLFKKQVKRLQTQKYSNIEFVSRCIDLNGLHELSPDCAEDSCSKCAKWICYTCDRNLTLDKIPNQASANNISLSEQPECLKHLNQLERHLVSPVIPFMKIIPLPKGQQKGVHGPVVCVPSNISTVTETLPRQISDSTLIKVKLKRKLEYRGHHLFQQVSMQRLKTALQYLKEINPHFSDVTVDMTTIDPDEEPGLVIPDDSHIEDNIAQPRSNTDALTDDGSHLALDQTVTSGTSEDRSAQSWPLTTAASIDRSAQSRPLTGTTSIDRSAQSLPITSTTSNDISAQSRPVTSTTSDDTSAQSQPVTSTTSDDTSAQSQPVTSTAFEDSTADIQPVTSTTSDNSSSPSQEASGDLTETSAPMVSCLQTDDLQQMALSQQHPEDHLSVAPAEGQRPCSVFQMEMKAFPYLFPDGKNGFDEKRQTKIGLGRYFNNRLLSKDARFASDPQYIFFSQFVTELNNVNSSVSIAIRKGAAKTSDNQTITAGMIADECLRKQILNSDKGYHFLKAVRGSPAYWEKTLRDLFAMVKQLGIPTWFCSFSAADRRWPEILEAICQQQDKPVPDNLDWSEYCHLINSNPVTACRMFEHRVLSFISDVILSPAKPIGDVVDYFYRTEFQSRGWPHIHCLFWCSDSPKFDSTDPNNSAFIDYIDQYVTCALPDPQQDPELNELVTSVQLHSKNHSRSCKKGSTKCRFNFPRPVSARTFIASPTPPDDSLQPTNKKDATDLLTTVWEAVDNADSQEIPATVKEVFHSLSLTQDRYQAAHAALASRNTVIFKREISDLWINPYNPQLLKAWNGNIDIQPVLDAYSCIMYIVSYISKAERELGDLLRKAQEEAEEGHTDPIQQLRQLGNVYLNSREISIMEAVYRVCGMRLKQSSREVVFVPADQNSARMTKPITVLQQADDADDDIWMTNIVDRYLARPETPEFENMSLADFASKYRVKDRTSNANLAQDNSSNDNENVYNLQNGKGSIVKRKTQAVVRYTNYNRDKHSESYYYNIICMYYPHRLADFKPPEIATYEEMFHQFSHIILPNMQSYEQLSQDLDDAWESLQNDSFQEDAWANIAANQEVNRIEEQEELDLAIREMMDNSEEIELSDIPDLCPSMANSARFHPPPSVTNVNRNTQNEHLEMLRTLNEKQSQLFFFIKQWAERKEHGDVDPFYVFLTGGAGTGKSHTIKCIFNEVDRALTRNSENAESPVVLLVAYTGTAAFNIGGQTIHSAFAINKGMSKQLAEESANTLRANLQDLQLLIIDEVSMVSTNLLNLIHCRLQQIKQPSKPNSFFGNVSILAVGDFYQIPPIHGKSLISVNNSLTDLWSLFSIWELNEVVRQKGDNRLIAMLNRIRDRQRQHPLNKEDIDFLQSRIVSQDDESYPMNVLQIAPLHKQLDVYNSRMLNLVLETETLYEIEAADICHDKTTQKTFRRKEPLSTKDTSLPMHLTLCVNARIMLTMNLDVSDGLTNGAIGTVTAVIPGKMPLGQPTAICVLFDHTQIGAKSRSHTTPPCTANPMSTVIKAQTDIIQRAPYQVTRHQFPFILAWAVTIHKVQGITTDRAIVSLKGIFKPGMAYVALSRVTSGEGLYLLDEDFDLDMIYADPRISKQLQLMPKVELLPDWRYITTPEVTQPQHCLIAGHNCEGYFPHFHDMVNNAFLHKADIIALQETWTSPQDTIENPFPRHVPIFRHKNQPEPVQHQNQRTRGGVALLVHSDYDFTPIDTSTVNLQCVGVELTSPSLSIISVYKPPELSLQYFCDQLSLLLRQIHTNSSVIVGDFNVDLQKSPDNQLVGTLAEYIQVISNPTTRRRTLIDHVYIKDLSIIQTGTVPTYYSYHDITYAVVDCII